MEESTEENEKLVQSICDGDREPQNSVVAKAYDVIYEIDCFVMEVNSGASFEQYFRWAKLEQIARIVSQLEVVGLFEVARITK